MLVFAELQIQFLIFFCFLLTKKFVICLQVLVSRHLEKVLNITNLTILFILFQVIDFLSLLLFLSFFSFNFCVDCNLLVRIVVVSISFCVRESYLHRVGKSGHVHGTVSIQAWTVFLNSGILAATLRLKAIFEVLQAHIDHIDLFEELLAQFVEFVLELVGPLVCYEC